MFSVPVRTWHGACIVVQPVAGGYEHIGANAGKMKTNMTIIETLPEAYTPYVISSIINLVCPRCGGRMMEFQCYGKCRKNWFPEWQQAHNEMQ